MHGEHPCEVVLEIPPFTNQKYDEQKEILEIYKQAAKGSLKGKIREAYDIVTKTLKKAGII